MVNFKLYRKHSEKFNQFFSGDLTNAIDSDKIVAKQFEEEWKLYHNFQNSCRTESGISNWLDIRGNHGKKLISK